MLKLPYQYCTRFANVSFHVEVMYSSLYADGESHLRTTRWNHEMVIL